MKQYYIHKSLEKSSIIRVRISYVRQWFFKPHTVRIANARDFYWLGLNISIRRPWLLSSARALHPELFNKENQ